MREFKFDEIGYWSEIKLAIIREYAQAYSTIFAKQRNLTHLYIDGFAGAGVHISKTSGTFVPGSPLNALLVTPPFSEYHLIDLNTGKAEHLRTLTQNRPDVFVYDGDCNKLLLDQVLPRAKYEDFKRALCILDPYGLHLDWNVIQRAGQMRSIDMFLNFPVMDMNMNVLWRQPDLVDRRQADRLTRFWGDETWRQAAYDTESNLFAFEEKTSNDAVAQAFKARLKDVAGFQNVIDPIPMRNNQGATVYYLFFASQNAVGNTIAKSIFAKYKDQGQIYG